MKKRILLIVAFTLAVGAIGYNAFEIHNLKEDNEMLWDRVIYLDDKTKNLDSKKLNSRIDELSDKIEEIEDNLNNVKWDNYQLEQQVNALEIKLMFR